MVSNEVIESRDFSGFSVVLKTGSRRKQRLSNKLSIRVQTNRGESNLEMTLREAKALRNFLNEKLG